MHAYLWAAQQWENTWGAKKIKSRKCLGGHTFQLVYFIITPTGPAWKQLTSEDLSPPPLFKPSMAEPLSSTPRFVSYPTVMCQVSCEITVNIRLPEPLARPGYAVAEKDNSAALDRMCLIVPSSTVGIFLFRHFVRTRI